MRETIIRVFYLSGVTIILFFPIVFPCVLYLLGYEVTSTRGVSMQPTLTDGSLILKQTRLDPYSLGNGTIISYRNSVGENIMHRIVAVNNGYYTVKGDNNPCADPPVYPENITGFLVWIIWKV